MQALLYTLAPVLAVVLGAIVAVLAITRAPAVPVPSS
jgi:hypothetical protein